MTSEQDLRYSSHLSLYEDFLTGDGERDAYWYFEAQNIHTLCVVDAVGAIQTELVSIGQRLGISEAYYQLVFGVARRSKFIWGALRQLYSLVSPSRRNPLPLDDAEEAARALNDIYIHLLGALDNYAWALIHLFGGERGRSLRRNEIGLFGRDFRRLADLSEFHSASLPFVEWNRSIRQRRDPVAHRIPLSVPPAIQDSSTIEIYREVERKHSEALQRFFSIAEGGSPKEIKDATDEADRYFSMLQTIGKFAPLIVHDPNEDEIPIYPTVPEDIGIFVLLSRDLNRKIVARLESR